MTFKTTDEMYAYINRHGQSVSYSGCYGGILVRGGPFATVDEADRDLAEQLVARGYRPPKWFEFWRRSEMTPSPAVIEIMREGAGRSER